MLIVTTEHVSGKEIEMLGLVKGSTIQTVNAFYDQYLPLFEPCDPLSEYFLTINEVKLRYIDFFPGKQIIHLHIEKAEIKGSESFKIRCAVRQKRRLASLNKIVICTKIKRWCSQFRNCLA